MSSIIFTDFRVFHAGDCFFAASCYNEEYPDDFAQRRIAYDPSPIRFMPLDPWKTVQFGAAARAIPLRRQPHPG